MGEEAPAVDYSAAVEKHLEISDQVIKGGMSIEEGLKEMLDVIPLGCKDTGILETNAEAILSVLASVKEVKESYISTLSVEEQSWLMMYVYKGLGASENKEARIVPPAQIMFKWFNTIYKVGGDGCVMRAVSRRKAL
ncbi:hypothetical protein ENUP19_0370G0010 [Entamoeba nuttalli]|uniref:Actin-related protein 2/3 complex subunit 5 n=1 Tax=Entamoeba nuttalli TaxID=412467 RepID=A0ABQ0DYV6_9EUKA